MSESNSVPSPTAPSMHFVAITAADADLASVPRAIFVGGGGTIVATPASGAAAVTFTVAAGTLLPIRPKRIAAASTATGIVGFY
jgi:hypothetical protein